MSRWQHSARRLRWSRNSPKRDPATDKIRRQADHWRDIAAISDEAAAALIREDAIDILVDLAGHTAHHRLLVFARGPAPVQVTHFGYPNTTGMRAMDYRITDAVAGPEERTEAFQSETLLRLPHVAWC